MRVLLSTISLHAERGGGTAQRTRFLARYLNRAGVASRVVTMEDGDLAAGLRAEGIPVTCTGYLKLPYHVPLANLWQLDRLVRDADALHIMGHWNLLSVALAWLARRRGRPYLLSAAGEFAALDSSSRVKRAFHRLVGARMVAGAAAIVAITELERCFIIERLGIAPDRVLVLANAVEVDSSEAASDARLPTRPYVLFMGRIAPIKGPDLLLEAFAKSASKIQDLKLVFAGPDGGMLASLRQRAAALGLANRVVFTGFLDERARRAAYQKSRLLVVPSRDEAMSLVAVEAGSYGLPVLLTDRCGFDEVADVGGGLVVSASVEGLAHGLEALLADPQRASAMGARLKAHVLSTYTWNAVVEKLRLALQRVAAASRR